MNYIKEILFITLAAFLGKPCNAMNIAPQAELDRQTAIKEAIDKNSLADVHLILSGYEPDPHYATFNIYCLGAADYLFHMLAGYTDHRRAKVAPEIMKKLDGDIKTFCITEPDAAGNTPLHHAIMHNNYAFVMLLLENLPEDKHREYVETPNRESESCIQLGVNSSDNQIQTLFIKFQRKDGTSPVQHNPLAPDRTPTQSPPPASPTKQCVVFGAAPSVEDFKRRRSSASQNSSSITAALNGLSL